ncbi:MAG: ComF family protein [Chitinophagales bacterium]|nr:ComF family protein [Chitinophagales bacterium]MBP8753627.1 ComF family protein [Chitinophagales bacterium]MBP9188362.1 ComF family protein [Chitinophagales bacterium]MBP9547598.1 ComF family protein [Chitinophagales bacterium]MBP9704274.1 ComF family protein [Chitinophagales bacterium]
MNFPLKVFIPIRDLMYPHLCMACDNLLSAGEEFICIACRMQLPKTDYHTFFDNPVAKHFMGKFPFEGATGMFHFNKSSHIQKLLHNLKYKHQPEVGKVLGQIMGNAFITTSPYNTIDFIIPVPLHPMKQEQRGYNQSTMIAMGIADVMHIPVLENALLRTAYTGTQTKKSRMERWENVKEKFAANPKYIAELSSKHLLLIDDVITTGSTLESCAMQLLRIPEIKISIAAAAHAEY